MSFELCTYKLKQGSCNRGPKAAASDCAGICSEQLTLVILTKSYHTCINGSFFNHMCKLDVLTQNITLKKSFVNKIF